MDWINADDEMFAFASKQTDQADTALYGRKTYEMMNDYWPTAGERPNASQHDIEHSHWYNNVLKVVLSKTIDGSELEKTQIINKNLSKNIAELKQKNGKNILIFGSATASHSLFKLSHGKQGRVWPDLIVEFQQRGVTTHFQPINCNCSPQHRALGNCPAAMGFAPAMSAATLYLHLFKNKYLM